MQYKIIMQNFKDRNRIYYVKRKFHDFLTQHELTRVGFELAR